MDKKTSIDEFLIFIKDHYVILIALSALLFSLVGYYNEYLLLKRFDLNIIIFAEIDDFFLAGLKNPQIFIMAFPGFALGIAYGLFSFNELMKAEKKLAEVKNKTEEAISEAKSVFYKVYEDQVLGYLILKYLKIFKKIDRNKISESINQTKEIISNPEIVILSIKQRIQIRLIGTLLIFIITIFGILRSELEQQLRRIIENPRTMVSVQLRNNITIPNFTDPNHPLVFITATNKFMFFYQHGADEETSTFAIPISSILKVQYSEIKI